MRIIHLAVLFSGNGSNAENLVKTLHQKECKINDEKIKFCVVAGFCNKKEAYGIDRLEKMGIQSIVVEHQAFSTRADFEEKLSSEIDRFCPDVLLLAGFMRILSGDFVKKYYILNIHPSLLPKYKGASAMKESFESDDEEVGASVHWVNEELDSGDLVLQLSRKRQRGENFEDFKKAIHQLEYELYPRAVVMAVEKLLKKEDNG